jgi:hypothetical protein
MGDTTIHANHMVKYVLLILCLHSSGTILLQEYAVFAEQGHEHILDG